MHLRLKNPFWRKKQKHTPDLPSDKTIHYYSYRLIPRLAEVGDYLPAYGTPSTVRKLMKKIEPSARKTLSKLHADEFNGACLDSSIDNITNLGHLSMAEARIRHQRSGVTINLELQTKLYETSAEVAALEEDLLCLEKEVKNK